MRRVLIGLAAGIVLALVGIIAFTLLFSGPELSVQVLAPKSVSVGKPILVTLRLSNPHNEAVALDSIDVDSKVFETARVVSVNPEPADGSIEAFGERTWWFHTAIQPGQHETVEFRFVAESAGLLQLEFGVCNAFQDCSRSLLTIEVLPRSQS